MSLHPIDLGALRGAFGVSYRCVGGLRFLKVGRLTLSWSVSAAYRPLTPSTGAVR